MFHLAQKRSEVGGEIVNEFAQRLAAGIAFEALDVLFDTAEARFANPLADAGRDQGFFALFEVEAEDIVSELANAREVGG